eukprot:CAMPEP_0176176804 /NCGR_PEP_ID=MMETSP0120_2-20121206/90567_1 /TAXON_ID=160619 /ORGANISM="Kryptoperidinium foliaceum, Strain CCMP 1326" /LENGTH=52 /DNA_ID=CAMNT_0017514867 /DNA_START=45 /DNA_END=200 /DNA_ORIENTATION=-
MTLSVVVSIESLVITWKSTSVCRVDMSNVSRSSTNRRRCEDVGAIAAMSCCN